MRRRAVVLGTMILLGLTTAACDEGADGATEDLLGTLEARIEGLEAALARSGQVATTLTISGADTLSCGDEVSYVDSIARTYKVQNECEFSAYVQVFDTDGNFDRQEKIGGYSTDSVTVQPFESVEVRCTYVTSPNGRCVVTAR